MRTCDPNVTEDLICSVYDLDPYYVEVLGATAGRSYSGLVKGSEPDAEAVLASNGRLEGMADSLARCQPPAYRRCFGGCVAGDRWGAGFGSRHLFGFSFGTAFSAVVFPGLSVGMVGFDVDFSHSLTENLMIRLGFVHNCQNPPLCLVQRRIFFAVHIFLLNSPR